MFNQTLLVKPAAKALAIAALLATSGAFAQTMSSADYSASKDRISADYKAAKANCDKLAGNEKDICVERAKGTENVAKAQLDFSRSGKADDGTKVAIAKADATYAVAKEMCDDKGGNAKDVCVKEAKAAHVKGLADAKLDKKVGAAKKDAAEEKREADYKVAAEKCESLSGDSKSACVSAAKVRFNKS